MGCRVRRWTAALALTVLITGCGGTSESPSAPAAIEQTAQATEQTAPATGQQTAPAIERTALAAPTPTPIVLAPADAGKRYLEIVSPYNEALEALENAANAGRSWTEVRTLAAEVARANATQAEDLRATAWPEQARPPMAALLAEIDVAQRHWDRAAKATTAEELGRAIQDAAAHSGAEQAGEVRAALGLPPYREP